MGVLYTPEVKGVLYIERFNGSSLYTSSQGCALHRVCRAVVLSKV